MDLFKVTLTGYLSEHQHRKNRMQIDMFTNFLLFANNGASLPQPNNPSYKVIADGVSSEIAFNISQRLKSLGCTVKIEPSAKTYYSQQEEKLRDYFSQFNSPVVCPRCGSNQISTGQRGFSIVTGFIGSNKTVNRCAKCGFSWKP